MQGPPSVSETLGIMKALQMREPLGELERLQRVAAVDLGQRNTFFTRLLQSDIWLVADLESESRAVLHTWKQGEETCPLFTSEALLEDAMEPGTPWIKLIGRTAFEMIAAEGLGTFINPRYEFQVRLRASEVKALLAGRLEAVRGSDA